ncbi:hypothetical protein NEA10_19715 [Phormidium yuhuli AB48]|uniref:Uncharacterized protein n=1 Tax=Phormidium yuhuli AB48 TaxID=2940671 RepID=A0ABY5ASB6_9CYAN|nr:hypothetical protein [Phormidium yuhuli]USR91023.1 hypothetical protein NEA10_19715 [Phormidium yuhuli AB48]
MMGIPAFNQVRRGGCQNDELWQAALESKKNSHPPIPTRDKSSSSTYNINQVGILNTGNVTNHGDQIGEQLP